MTRLDKLKELNKLQKINRRKNLQSRLEKGKPCYTNQGQRPFPD